MHSLFFAPVNTSVHWKVLSLSYHTIVVFEQLILFFKGSFSVQRILQITGITDALKKNAHDQNEQTILRYNLLKSGAFQRKCSNFNSTTSLSVTSVQISEFHLVCGIALS